MNWGDAVPSGDAVPHPPMLLFDGDCGFCTSSASWLAARLDPRVQVVPFQRVDLARAGIDPDRARREVLWVPVRGRVRGGADAVAQALASGRHRRWRLTGRVLALPPVLWVAGFVYRWVSRHRDRMPGGTPACAVPAAPDRRP